MNPAETGFFYLNSRYYDPETGRFISADAYVSTGQGVLGFNMYAYCRNNPATRVDIKGTYDKDTFEENNPDLADGTPDNDSLGGGQNAVTQTQIPTGTMGVAGTGGSSGLNLQGQSSQGSSNGQSIPENAWKLVDYVNEHNGTPPPGYKGGRTYQNDGRGGGQVLPPEYAPFREYDIIPYTKGVVRGAERVVIGGGGAAWYTPNHYMTFFEMKR